MTINGEFAMEVNSNDLIFFPNREISLVNEIYYEEDSLNEIERTEESLFDNKIHK